ncbi:hypothetical protein [Nostocoides sp. Soil756]|uniref:hypothetical protein n=1 Tax=Nostocoides sp. Soil756 TaxID=1736399 RepID=UPI0006F9D55B|nr:hypothetical protein [Tetrasphaera sp. Soil756]KRE62980.1 hypothetical protein ASG78_08510 [Tetrasphaera sp. Soil756]
MSTTQWILNLALLGWVLARNLGTHRVTRATFLVPLAVVVAAGAWFLRDLPTGGHDLDLDLVGVAAGLAFGTLAALLTTVHLRQGHLVASAGPAFAAVWVATIGGRMLFAQWATHDGARTIGEFSMRHQITGADAWTTAFVLMALTMVAVRLVVTAVQVSAHRSRSASLAEAGAA